MAAENTAGNHHKEDSVGPTSTLRVDQKVDAQSNMEHEVKPFRFLDLSGEIRNRIYDLCTGEQSMSLSHRQDTNICAGSNSGEYYSLASWDRNKNRDNQRAYVGLTQVSQLIRREYLPIYLSNNQVRIFLEDLRAYGETFLQMGAPHPSKVVSCTGPWESTCSNITSLVIFSAQHPNVEFVFEGSQNSTEVVNKLISTVQDPGYTDEWRDAIDTILEVNLAYLPYFLTTSANAYPEIRITIDKNLSGGNVDNGRRLWVSKFRSLAGIDQSDLDVKICVAKRSHWHTPHS